MGSGLRAERDTYTVFRAPATAKVAPRRMVMRNPASKLQKKTRSYIYAGTDLFFMRFRATNRLRNVSYTWESPLNGSLYLGGHIQWLRRLVSDTHVRFSNVNFGARRADGFGGQHSLVAAVGTGLEYQLFDVFGLGLEAHYSQELFMPLPEPVGFELQSAGMWEYILAPNFRVWRGEDWRVDLKLQAGRILSGGHRSFTLDGTGSLYAGDLSLKRSYLEWAYVLNVFYRHKSYATRFVRMSRQDVGAGINFHVNVGR